MPIQFFKLIIISAAILALTGCIRKVTESEANRTYIHYYKNNTLIKYEIANDSGQIIHQELYRNNRVVLNQSWNSKGILVYSSKYSKSGKIEIVEEYFDNGLHKFKAQVMCLDTIPKLDSASKPLYSIVIMYGRITSWDQQGRITMQMTPSDSARFYQITKYDTLGNVISREQQICR